MCQDCASGQVRTPAGRRAEQLVRTEPEQNDDNNDDPVSVPASSAALVAVCPAPPSCILAVHGPLVRRRPATSPAGTASTRACSQVRPGRSRRARRRSEERHWSAAAAPCHGPATAPRREERARFSNYFACPFPDHPARRRPYPPLPSSPGYSAIGQLRRHPPQSGRGT